MRRQLFGHVSRTEIVLAVLTLPIRPIVYDKSVVKGALKTVALWLIVLWIVTPMNLQEVMTLAGILVIVPTAIYGINYGIRHNKQPGEVVFDLIAHAARSLTEGDHRPNARAEMDHRSGLHHRDRGDGGEDGRAGGTG